MQETARVKQARKAGRKNQVKYRAVVQSIGSSCEPSGRNVPQCPISCPDQVVIILDPLFIPFREEQDRMACRLGIDGMMIDKPHLTQAWRTLELAH